MEERTIPRRLLAGAAALLFAYCSQANSAPPGSPPDAEICHSASAEELAASGARQVDVTLPNVLLQPMRGAPATLTQRIRTADAVLLNFIYTSCTSICPPMAHIFATAQERLGTRAAELQLVSVSIDPEHDSPKRLQAYATQFRAGPQWSFHTGSQAAVDKVQRAFQIYRPDKMGHQPVTFIKPRGQDGWLRVDGLARPEQLLALALGSPVK